MKEMLLASLLMNKNISALSENDMSSMNTFLEDNYLKFNLKDVAEFIDNKKKTFEESCKKECVLMYALNSDLNNPDVVEYLNTIEKLQEMEAKILENFENKKVETGSDISKDFAQCQLINESIDAIFKRKRQGIEQDKNGVYWVTGPFDRYGTTATVKLSELPADERKKYEAFI